MPAIDDPRALFAAALELIPTHRDPAAAPQDLAHTLAERLGVPHDQAVGAVQVLLGFLTIFNVLAPRNDGAIQLASQVPVYAIKSLLWFARHGQPMIDGWRGDPIRLTDPIGRDAIFDHAQQLLLALESRRQRLASAHGLPLDPVREQSAVVVLIKSVINGKAYYLHQFDQRANQYQLIGGRMEANEDVLTTAARELIEEVGPSQAEEIRAGEHFALVNLFDSAMLASMSEISKTYGALTHYRFYACAADFPAPVRLGRHDRWIEAGEMLRGRTNDGHTVANATLIRAIDARLAGGLLATGPLRNRVD
jgi:8-oxo-dGTP pyrophosphatase MutT (NUDIX family)